MRSLSAVKSPKAMTTSTTESICGRSGTVFTLRSNGMTLFWSTLDHNGSHGSFARSLHSRAFVDLTVSSTCVQYIHYIQYPECSFIHVECLCTFLFSLYAAMAFFLAKCFLLGILALMVRRSGAGTKFLLPTLTVPP